MEVNSQETSRFLGTLVDALELNYTHSINFELRKLSPKQRSEVLQDLRHLQEDLENRKSTRN